MDKEHMDTARVQGRMELKKYTLKEGQTEKELLDEIEKGKAFTVEPVIAHNTWLNTGWNEILKLITGESANHFSNTNAQIGVGYDTTASSANASQTGLIGSSTKYKGMVSGYPTSPSSQTIQFRAVFLTNEANFEHNEVVVYNSASGVSWNRIYDAGLGTKTANDIWQYTVTIGKT